MNTIKFTIGGARIIQNGDVDRRPVIVVNLLAQNRPKYYKFHCVYCGSKVAELSGQVVSIQDVDNESRYIDTHAPVRVPCKGRIDGEWCRMWYHFANLL